MKFLSFLLPRFINFPPFNFAYLSPFSRSFLFYLILTNFSLSLSFYVPAGSSARFFLFSLDSLPPLSLFSVYLHISPPRLPFSESHGGSRLFSQPASPCLLSLSLIPFISIPFHPRGGRARSFVSIHLSVPLAAGIPFASFSASLFLFLSLASSPS